MRRLALTAALAVLAAGPVLAQSRPPGQRPDPTSVEAGLWRESDEMERGLRNGGLVVEDEALNAYVRDVACRVAPEYCEEVRVYVTSQPALNASVAPNGMIDVWSGLLLRAGSEDELAFVLGHELGHYAENHTVERWTNIKITMGVTMVVAVGVGVAGAYYGVDTSGFVDIAYYGGLAAIFSFSRAQESQADEMGYLRAVAAGYDPNAGVNLWTYVISETAASDLPSVRRQGSWGSAFRSHPLNVDRIQALRALAPEGETGGAEDRHRAAVRPFLGRWLREDLRRRDFGQTLAVINRLQVGGDDYGVLEFYRGEVHRLRRQDGDVRQARDAYARAVDYPDAPADAWRELGEMNRRLGEHDAALTAFQTYLDRAPEAEDRWLVEDAISSLQGAST